VKPLRICYLNAYLRGDEVAAPPPDFPRLHLWGADFLRERGHEVIQVAPHGDDALSRAARKAADAVGSRLGQTDTELRVLRALDDCDVLYVAIGNLLLLPLLRSLRVLRPKIALWMYRPPPHRPPWKISALRGTSAYLRGFDGFPCNNSAAARYYEARCPWALVRAIPVGADLHYYTPESPLGSYALCAGRTFRDYDTLLRAAPHCRSPIRLIVPAHYIAGARLAPNVEHIASAPDPEAGIPYSKLMREHFAGARCVVIPLLHDPADTAGYTNLLEAMGMGKPVIMTRTGALDLDIEKLGFGIYVPPGDAEALGRAIDSLFSDEGAALRMGRRARELAVTQYNRQRFGEDVERFLLDLRER
jgi:glycosyltransferase involved in cell wall biosynthesis